MAKLLEMRNIRKEFPGMIALDGVSFDLEEGEIHALLGENGAGKSTLMNVLFGLCRRDGGEIFLRGERVNLSDPEDSYRHGIRLIPQELNLVSTLTVRENIYAGHLPVNRFGLVDWKRMHEGAGAVLRQLGLEHIDLKQKVGELSVSQQQMIAIARSFQQSPSIIVFDEPTSALSREETNNLFEMIARLKKQGIGIIYITHRLEEVVEIADRVTVMREGHISGHCGREQISVQWIMDVMTGLSEEERYPYVPHTAGEEVRIEGRGLVVGDRVKGVSLQVRAGEILGITGFVGAGKTELSRVLFGADRQQAGEVIVEGEAAPRGKVGRMIRKGVALIPEDRRKDGLITSRSILENMTLSTIDRYARVLGVMDKKKERETAQSYIKSLSIATTDAYKRVRYLSGGNQQKVVIAKWLNAGARIFIFDEATRGIDVKAKAEIYRLMGELAAQGAAVINISMEFQEVLGVSDRILVMREGVFVGELTREEATLDRLYTMAGGENNAQCDAQ